MRASTPASCVPAGEPASPANVVARIAAEHAVCPYYLNQEMLRWADVVVADYNHWFDRSAVVHAMAQEEGWRVALLVDEAHNLVDRARQMFSGALRWSDLQRARKAAPPALAKPLRRIARAWSALALPEGQTYAGIELPADFVKAIERSSSEWLEAMAREPAAAAPDALRFHFDAMHFEALCASLGDHSMVDLSIEPQAPTGHQATIAQRKALPRPTLAIRNVVPAPFVGARLAAAHASVLFSATLAPFDFYADMLGVPSDAAFLDVDSPFASDQLEVRIAANLSTRWRDRAASVDPIVDAIARQHRSRPGNYLAFFGSYAYLQAVADRFAACHPGIATWRQQTGMAEDERDALLRAFVAAGPAGGVAFAVLGGAFAEGIDLPGEQLIGAFVATLGMPQIDPVNEAMRARLDQRFGDGHAYTYFVPGMRKVVQAAGRVIRTPQDRGVVVLLDDRFARADARRVMPSWWRPTTFRVAR